MSDSDSDSGGLVEQVVITAFRHKRHVVSVTMHDRLQPNYSYQDRFVVCVDGERAEFLTLFDGEREAACAAGACVRVNLQIQLEQLGERDPIDEFERLICAALAVVQQHVDDFQARISNLVIVMLTAGDHMAIARTGHAQCVGVSRDEAFYQLTGVARPIDRTLSATCALEIILRSTSDLVMLLIATDKLWDTLDHWTVGTALLHATRENIKANKVAKMLVNQVCNRAEIDRLGLLCYNFSEARNTK